MVSAEPRYHVTIDATFADKVCAIRRLVELYRRTMPTRAQTLEQFGAQDILKQIEEPERAIANSANG